MRVGILVHGLHLQANGWEQTVWGDKEEFGSLPKAVEMMLTFGLENVASVVFGTGASKRGGFREGEYTCRELMENMRRLEDYPSLHGFHEFQSTAGLVRLSELIDGATLELAAQNTFEEITNAAQHFAQAHCDLIIQVPTCGSHAPRCVKTFLQVKAAGKIPAGQTWMLAPSETTFAGSTIDDVAVVEPPHRGDDPMLHAPVKMHEVVQRFFKLQPEERMSALIQVSELLHLHECYKT